MSAHFALVVALAVAGLTVGRPQRALVARLVRKRPGPPPPPSPCVREPVAHEPPPADVRVPRVPFWERSWGVGLVTGVLLGAFGARVHPGFVLAAACALALCAVPLAFIDVAVHRLPDVLTAAAYAGTMLLLLLAAAAGGHWGDLARAALGGVALAGVYLTLLLISPSGMGLGDVKLAASLGTLLAWSSWRTLVLGGFAGFLLAAVYSIALLATRRATRKQHIPFGPFMIAGAFAVILASHV